ncbi:MAG: site-specific integrase [Elusimicrobia bacterium]|nr:site-specific integrase [Elusimicrobiota bacterium]
MSGKRYHGNKIYLTYKVKVANPKFNPALPPHYKTNPRHLWVSKEIPVSKNPETFKTYKTNFDYDRERRGLGLHNDRKTWGDFVADLVRHSKAKKLKTHLRDIGTLKNFVRVLRPECLKHQLSMNELLKNPEAKFNYMKMAFAKVTDISYQEIQTYFEKRKVEGAMAGTLRGEYARLRAAFEMSIEWKYRLDNPVLQYPQPRAAQRRERFLNLKEEEDLLKAASARDSGEWLFALLFLDAGLRLEEACHARRKWVELPRNALAVTPWEGEDWSTKNYLIRDIPLTRRLRAALTIALKRSGAPKDPLIPGPNGIWHWRTMEKHFTALFKTAEIKGATIHTLRHTFCTRMHRKGVRLKTIKKWMGHQNIQTTEIYCHVDDQESQEEMRRADQEMPE